MRKAENDLREQIIRVDRWTALKDQEIREANAAFLRAIEEKSRVSLATFKTYILCCMQESARFESDLVGSSSSMT